jgi:indolepyruvate ferredoxin oxidoreductase
MVPAMPSSPSTRSSPAPSTATPDLAFPQEELSRQIVAVARRQRADFVDATRLAAALLGDSIATNLFMLGYAYQQA